MPGAAPGAGRSPSPGFIQAGRDLHIPQFGAASLAAPSTSRSSTGWALGLSGALAHFQQGWPEGSPPGPCGASAPQPLWAACPATLAGLQWGMSLQQKVLERAQG